MSTTQSRRRRSDPFLALDVTPEHIAGAFRPGAAVPAEIALLLDGAVLATVRTEAGRFAWALPPEVLGRLLDVVAVGTGKALLVQPFALETVRSLRWLGWKRDGTVLAGRFAIDGPAAPPLDRAIPVELMSEDGCYGRCFAAREGEVYRFRAPLDRLPARQGELSILPRVGSMLVRDMMRVPVEAFGVRGRVEPSEPWRVHGWVAGAGGPVEVELRVDGRAVATAFAAEPREDVAAAGLGDGAVGFEFPLPLSAPLDRPVLVDLRIAGGGPSLAGSPYLRPPAPPHLGFLDSVEGGYASGWAYAISGVGPLRVEAVCEGEVVGAGIADLHRGDVAEAGLPTSRCGFHFPLAPAGRRFGRDVVARIVGTAEPLQGSPRRVMPNPNLARLLGRSVLPASVQARLSTRLTRQTEGALLSIVMPVFETRRDWLEAAIASVVGQWCGRWELICVDDGSRTPHVPEVLSSAAGADRRVRVLRLPRNGGIARAVNVGVRAVRGDYVAFLDHDDWLEPDAVFHLLTAARETGADLLYSDEVLTGPDLGDVLEVRARPAFSHDFYLSHPYFVHLVCVRTALARALSGYDEEMPISADVDFVLRAVERANAVAHVPRVLYRWRTHAGSAGHAQQADVMGATRLALTRHLRRLGHPMATVRDGLGFNQFLVDWPDDGGEVLIVIPTHNRVELLRSCIDSIERTAQGEAVRIVVIDHQSTDPKTVRYLRRLGERHTVMPYRGKFNFARMNNAAVRRHGGDARYVLFMNNDVEAIAPGWLPRLRSLAARPEVGAVGPLLLYGNDRVQHGGVLIGFSGAADHAMRLRDAFGPDGARNPGYNCNLTAVRDYSAVTAACLLMRLDAFRAVGGFEPGFAVGFNDTDLCLRLRECGLKVLYDGHTVLYHHESATRIGRKEQAHPQDDERLRRRWRRYFTGGDPFYSPLLSDCGTDHLLRSDAGWRGKLHPRTVALPGRRAEMELEAAPVVQTRAWARRTSNRVSSSG